MVFDGILNREPVPPSTINHTLPNELDRIIARALEKDRELRYQTAADLRADLQRLRRDSGSRRASASEIGAGVRQLRPRHASSASDCCSSGSLGTRSRESGEPAGRRVRAGRATARGSGTGPTRPQHVPPATPWALIGTGVVAVAAPCRWIVGDEPIGSAWPRRPLPRPLTAAPDTQASAPAPLPPTPAVPSPRLSLRLRPTVRRRPRHPRRTPTAATKPAVKPAAKSPAAKSPAPTVPAAATRKDAEAAERLEVARAKLASNLVDQAVADFRQILLDYPGSAAAADASFLAAEALQKAGRTDDAMAMYVEFDRRFAGSPRVADSKLRRARLLQQTRNQARQSEGYALYGEIVRELSEDARGPAPHSRHGARSRPSAASFARSIPCSTSKCPRCS